MLVRIATSAAAVVLATASLAACGTSTSTGTSPSTTTSQSSATAPLTVADPWAKAATAGMTAAFGTLNNPGTTDVTVVSASTSASSRTELHEVVMKDGAMVMQPKPGGFVVPAGGSLTLKPGADHIMIMDLTSPVKPGDVVKVTLKLNTGASVSFDATAKDFSGGSETYQPSASAGTGMSMG